MTDEQLKKDSFVRNEFHALAVKIDRDIVDIAYSVTDVGEEVVEVTWRNGYKRRIPDEDLDNALNEVIALAPRYQQIKEGNLKPQRCGDCPYCRFTEVLTEPVNYHEELEVYDVECG